MPKILNLLLKYKGNVLDKVMSNRDFSSTFTIGNDPHLLWQILDRTFPRQHKFVTRVHSEKFDIHLLKNMEITVNRDNQTMSMADLTSKKMVKGNVLTIDPSMSGNITIGSDWQIEYAFETPYVHSYTREEQQLKQTFGRFGKLDPNSKFTITMLVLIVVFALGGMLYMRPVWERASAKFNQEKSLVEELEAAKAISVTPVAQPTTVETSGGMDEEVEEEPVEEPKDEPKEKPKVNIAKRFGSPTGGGSASASKALANIKTVSQTTTVSIFASSSAGTKKSGGSGSGQSSAASKLSSQIGSGGSLADQMKMRDLSLGSVATGNVLAGANDLNLKNVTGKLAGKIGSSETIQVRGQGDIKKIQRQFAFAKEVNENTETIGAGIGGSGGADAGNNDRIILTMIDGYKSQLTKAYNNAFRKSDIFGTIQFKLYIDVGGAVVLVEMIEKGNSKFTDDVKEQFRQLILKWKFTGVNEKRMYPFTMSFGR